MIKKKNLLNYCGLHGADDKSRGGSFWKNIWIISYRKCRQAERMKHCE